MAALELETRACTVLLFEVIRLLGRTEVENGGDEEEQLLLRLLCPIMKLYTGKQTVPVVSEGLECIGGQGYIEDTGIPRLLRDTQVTPIWEGTTNILSLDVLRAIGKSKGEVMLALERNLTRRLQQSAKTRPELSKEVHRVFHGLKETLQGGMVQERSARLFAFSLAALYITHPLYLLWQLGLQNEEVGKFSN